MVIASQQVLQSRRNLGEGGPLGGVHRAAGVHQLPPAGSPVGRSSAVCLRSVVVLPSVGAREHVQVCAFQPGSVGRDFRVPKQGIEKEGAHQAGGASGGRSGRSVPLMMPVKMAGSGRSGYTCALAPSPSEHWRVITHKHWPRLRQAAGMGWPVRWWGVHAYTCCRALRSTICRLRWSVSQQPTCNRHGVSGGCGAL